MKHLWKGSAVLLMGLSLLLTACGGSKADAAAMHLKRSEGTVDVQDEKEKTVELIENLGLYSGYQVSTKTESFTWIDLDQVKLTKLDEDSAVTVVKDGKSLTLDIEYGSLFFNVTEPLTEDETLDIRSSDMLVGIRGTCGWVDMPDETHMNVYLLKGAVECSVGEDSSITITAGTMAALDSSTGQITTREFSRDEVPAFVASELTEDFLNDALPSGTDNPAMGEESVSDEGLAENSGMSPTELLESLRQSAVSYDDILVIQIAGGGAPNRLEPAEATGFINGVVLDINGDGQEELVTASADSANTTKVEVYDGNGNKVSEASGSFYGTAEYGGGDSTMDILLYQNPTLNCWCVAFCDYIQSNVFHVMDASLYSIGEGGGLQYVDRWYWDDISDMEGAELSGLQTEMTAAGWPSLDTDFLSFRDDAAMESAVWLSRAQVRKDGNDRYLHIFSPEELAAIP